MESKTNLSFSRLVLFLCENGERRTRGPVETNYANYQKMIDYMISIRTADKTVQFPGLPITRFELISSILKELIPFAELSPYDDDNEAYNHAYTSLDCCYDFARFLLLKDKPKGLFTNSRASDQKDYLQPVIRRLDENSMQAWQIIDDRNYRDWLGIALYKKMNQIHLLSTSLRFEIDFCVGEYKEIRKNALNSKKRFRKLFGIKKTNLAIKEINECLRSFEINENNLKELIKR